jgi:RNA polymerase sigma factor (TIGR02999 family)
MNAMTQILNAIEDGDPQAAAQLLPLVYDELRQLAAQKLAREKPGHTLDATALVHEAYVRLVGGAAPRWKDRSHFYAAAAEAMRRILIDRARKKKSQKRGGGQQHQEWPENIEAVARPADDLLAIDEALTLLADEDGESAQLVKLRFYAGLSVEEAADTMGLARATAYRTWKYAKAWLRTKLADSPDLMPSRKDAKKGE